MGEGSKSASLVCIYWFLHKFFCRVQFVLAFGGSFGFQAEATVSGRVGVGAVTVPISGHSHLSIGQFDRYKLF